MIKPVKGKVFGIFGKIFIYTCILLILVVSALFVLFYGQIRASVMLTQQRQVGEAFSPLVLGLRDKSDEEIIRQAEDFHNKNTSFDFAFIRMNGSILYQTEGFTLPEKMPAPSPSKNRPPNEDLQNGPMIRQSINRQDDLFMTLMVGDKRLLVSSPMLATSIFKELIGEVLLAFGLILLISMVAAWIFARRIANPIYQRLMDTMESQRYFFMAASHELKTPIAATKSILEGVAENVIAPEDHRHYIREAIRLQNEQSVLVAEILDLVKMSDTSTTPILEPLDLTMLIDNTLDSFTPIFEAKNQQLITDLPEIAVASTDARLLTKAITNIFQNATQNSPENADIFVSIKQQNDGLILSIENTGTHISDEKMSKLFQPFYMQDEARSKNTKRNGLGLTIVKKALELLSLPFSISNTKDGVRFTIEFKGNSG